MTKIYLAYGTSTNRTLKKWDHYRHPLNILVSYVYLKAWRQLRKESLFPVASLKLDSGAFSAWNAGKTINIDELTSETKNEEWSEAVSLDVIGDAEASVQNAIYMKNAGSKAYPVFHYGDPWHHLLFYKQHFPKVGLSCRFGEKESDSLRWLEKCFARAWPYKFHSFGWTKESMLINFPFHSADSSTWATAPSAYGAWHYGPRVGLIGRGMRRLSVRGIKNIDVTVSIRHYISVQEQLKERWKKELANL